MDQLTLYQVKRAGVEAVKSALIAEAELRNGRTFKEWTESEAKAVWSATRDFAQQNCLRIPKLEEVVRVERQACGHSDYGSKWAIYAVELTFVS